MSTEMSIDDGVCEQVDTRDLEQILPSLTAIGATAARSSGTSKFGDPGCIIEVTLYGATSLAKRDIFRLPDTFAELTVDGEQTKTTDIVRRTSNPVWNKTFKIKVQPLSMIAIQIFDHMKFRRRDQGFLGVCYIPAADAIQFAEIPLVAITRDLRKSSSSIPVYGKISLGFSFAPMPQQPPASLPSNSTSDFPPVFSIGFGRQLARSKYGGDTGICDDSSCDAR